MREQEFRDWFGTIKNQFKRPYTKRNLEFYVGAVSNIEKAEKIDMDKAFQKDGMAWISNLYSYSVQDNENNTPNPTKVALTKPTVYSTLADHKTALNHYRKFCETNPPK